MDLILRENEVQSGRNSLNFDDFEAETRAVVMDFMGLVPLSCPPASTNFKPFSRERQRNERSEFTFDNDVFVKNTANNNTADFGRLINGNVTKFKKSTPKRLWSSRCTDSSSDNKLSRQSSNFRTIIRRHDKVVVLEDTFPTDQSDNQSIIAVRKGKKTEILSESIAKSKTERRQNGIFETGKSTSRNLKKIDLSLNMKTFVGPKLLTLVSKNLSFYKPLIGQELPRSQGSVEEPEKLSPSFWKPKHNDIWIEQGGSSVDLSPLVSSSTTFDNTRHLNRFESNRENLYVDVNKAVALESLVDKGEISPAAVPLQSELHGLRLNDNTGLDLLISGLVQPLSPHSQVADTLRAVADQVQEEFSQELSGAVGRLVGFEEAKILTFEVLREVAMELIKDISPGWTRVVLPLVLSQSAAMTLLLLGNRSIVGRLVDYTTRFLCDNMNEFLSVRGGWDSVRETGIRQVPMTMEDFQRDVGR